MTRLPKPWELWMDLDVPFDSDEPPKLREGAPEEIKKKFEEWKQQKNEDDALLVKLSREKRVLLRRRVVQAIESQFKEGLELSQEGVILSPAAMVDLIANCNVQGEWTDRMPYKD